MRNRFKVLISVLLVLTLVLALSCRNQPEIPNYSQVYTGTNFTSWGTLFDAYWQKMNHNYVFWHLDDGDGTWWDKIYETYSPKFNALGAIYDSEGNVNTYQMKEAERYFFDITRNLSDGHYAVAVDLVKAQEATETTPAVERVRIVASPSRARELALAYDENGNAFNPTEDEIFAVMSGNDTSSALYEAREKRRLERVFGVAFHTLTAGETQMTDQGEPLFLNAPNDETHLDVEYNATNLYVFNFESTTENPFRTVTTDGNVMNYFNYVTKNGSGERIDAFYGALGYVEKGILYFGFSGFSFSGYASEGNSSEPVIKKFAELATSSETKAVIIDVRGNGGGYINDLSLLWTVFMNDEPMTVGKMRRKGGENRTSYGPWTDYGFQVNAEIAKDYDDFDTSNPIVVLTNNGSVSCSEMTTMFFKALRDNRKYNVRILGEQTKGGLGMLNSGSSEFYYDSGTVNNLGQIYLMYTPFQETAYLNGDIYEGKGVPVDGDPILFKYSEFVGGKDAKFDAAIEWLKSEMK